MSSLYQSVMKAIARHHNGIVANRLGGIGLKIHDIWAETSEDITKATHRLPYEIQEARYRRMIRAGDILVKRKFWNKQQRAELDVMDNYLQKDIDLVNYEWNERKQLRGW